MFSTLSADISNSILGFVSAKDCGKLSKSCKEFRKTVQTTAFLKELTFFQSPKIGKDKMRATIFQHSSTLEMLVIPNMESVDGIDLSNLKSLLLTDEKKGHTDFSKFTKLECLGIIAKSFPKIDTLSLPKTIQHFYTCYQLTSLQFEYLEKTQENLKSLFVYNKNLTTTRNKGYVYSFNKNRVFMEKWNALEEVLAKNCGSYLTFDESDMNEESEYDEDENSEEDDGDYNLFQYNEEWMESEGGFSSGSEYDEYM